MSHEPPLKEFYFNKFEHRQPYRPLPQSELRNMMFQFLAIIALAVGGLYIWWRWKYSLNMNCLWFAIPLIVAETLSFVSTIFLYINYWSPKDRPITDPVHYLSEIEDLNGRPDRPISIDIHIATYNEDVELVRYTIRDAKKVKYPFEDVTVKVFVLDDGRRDGRDPSKQNMKKVCEEEGVGYFSRENNEGFKAGNLRNGLEHTQGDLFVILDADARPFESMLINTTGYFRAKKLAWVQTPQWFYDTSEPVYLKDWLTKKAGWFGRSIGWCIELIFGRVYIEEDIFGNHPEGFYDGLLRRRNFHNAAFCCGAGSIHRREAVMELAVKDYAKGVRNELKKKLEAIGHTSLSEKEILEYKRKTYLDNQLIPFKFHASEDIYTSMMLHAQGWESYEHPYVECKMLSPQDIDTWVKQRSRYAAGSLDIAFKDNPLFMKGLTWGQRICYFSSIYSYFAPLWLIIFIFSPIIFYFTLALPVQAYSFDFMKYYIPFQLINAVAIALVNWGRTSDRSDQYYIASFWLMTLSIISVIIGKKVQFHVTPKEKSKANYLPHIWPHILIISLIVIGNLYNLVLIFNGTHPSISGYITNTFWSLFTVYNLSVMIRAAWWEEKDYNINNPLNYRSGFSDLKDTLARKLKWSTIKTR